MVLIYCYDAYCGWCYGFSPVIKKIQEHYAGTVPVEVLSGGMILPDYPTPIAQSAPYILQAYKTVEEYAGVTFGEDYLWHLKHADQSDWFPNSEKPAIALSILKEQSPEKAVSFASDLQYALHFEGRDLTDDEAYRHLLPKYGLDPGTFYEKLHSDDYRKLAHDDFAMVKKLQVTAFPQLLVQISDSKFFLVARGYTPYETVLSRIENVMKENS